MAKKWFKWTAEIQVHVNWVEDGFDLTQERLHDIMTNELRHAYGEEIRCKILSKPVKRDLQEAWGEKPPRKRKKKKGGA